MIGASAVGSALLLVFWCLLPLLLIVRFRITGFFLGFLFFWFAPIALVHIKSGVPFGGRFARAYGEWLEGGWVLSLLYNAVLLAALVFALRFQAVRGEARPVVGQPPIDDGESSGCEGTESP